MATLNADLSTALRLNLTYTHRVAKYGSLVNQTSLISDLDPIQAPSPQQPAPFAAGLSQNSAPIEAFFAWGVNHIPREAIQDAICPTAPHHPIGACHICNPSHNNPLPQNKMNLKQIVNIPLSLSYHFPYHPTSANFAELHTFLHKHNSPNTVFQMPPSLCNKSPAYSKFSPSSRSFFFHKYWSAHDPHPTLNPSLRLYRSSWSTTLRIPTVPPRAPLPRLHAHELTIAIHARRGDFFAANRPMVSTPAFARVVRAVVNQVNLANATFARMPVAVNIYSEGHPANSQSATAIGHDVALLSKQFREPDGRILSEETVRRLFEDRRQDKLGDVFRNGLRVSLRVSEDTVLSLHEMIASDVFVGSVSGMSLHLVGSLSRGAMQVLPQRSEEEGEWRGHVLFDGRTGRLQEGEVRLVARYWREFEAHNEKSARKAWETYQRSKQL